MSETNLQLLRRGYEAFNSGDIGTVLGLMTDDVEFVVAENSTYYRGAPYVGKEELATQIFARVGAEWDGYRIVVEKLFPAGDYVVMQGRYRGTYKATGRMMNAQVVHIWTLRDSKLAKLEQYADTAGMQGVTMGAIATAI